MGALPARRKGATMEGGRSFSTPPGATCLHPYRDCGEAVFHVGLSPLLTRERFLFHSPARIAMDFSWLLHYTQVMNFRVYTVILLLFVMLSAPCGAQWQRHTIDTGPEGADGVRLLDVNGDGRLDIATGWEEAGLIRAYLQPEPHGLRDPWPQVTVAAVASPEDAVFVDLDGDGAVDIVSACEGTERKVYIHWAPVDQESYLDAEAWQTESLPAAADRRQWMYVLPKDMNGNGRMDLVAGAKGPDAAIGWFENPENPRDVAAWRWHTLASAHWIMSIEAVDMNGDDREDVLYSERRGPQPGVYWFEAPEQPGGEWLRHTIFSRDDYEPMFLTHHGVGEEMVVFTAIRDHGVLRSVPEKGEWSHELFPLPEQFGIAKGVAVASIYGKDKEPALLLSAEQAFGKRGLVALDARTGAFLEDIGGRAGTKFDLVQAVDLSGNGCCDVLTCEEAEGLGVVWYENPHCSAGSKP